MVVPLLGDLGLVLDTTTRHLNGLLGLLGGVWVVDGGVGGWMRVVVVTMWVCRGICQSLWRFGGWRVWGLFCVQSYLTNEPLGRLKMEFVLLVRLEGIARYAGLLLATAEGFGLRPRLFLPFGQKKSLLCCFGPFLAFFGVQ